MNQEYEGPNKQNSDVIEGYLKALFGFYASGYYLDLKRERYHAIGQMKEYSMHYNKEDDWSRMDDYIRECIHEEDQALITEVSRIDYIRERLKKEQNYSIEVRDYGTGTERWYRFTVMRCVDEDHAAIALSDVTDQVLQRQEMERLSAELEKQNKQFKENQNELEKALISSRETSEMLNRVHEILGSATWKIEYDETGKNETKVEFTDGFRRLFGYESEQDYPNSLDFMMSRVYPTDKDRMLNEVYEVVKSPNVEDVNITTWYRAYRKDGALRWYRVQGVVTRREDGSAQLSYGVTKDITDYEETEIAQKETLEAFESVHDALGSANWQMNFDKDGNMTSCIWSDRFRRMLGYESTKDFPNKLSSWTDLLHPADKERTLRDYWAAVNDHAGKTIYSVKYRLRTKEGHYRWFSAHGSLTRFDDGTPKIYYGLFLDINDQMLAQEKQENQLKEIMVLNAQLEENQAQLEEVASEQEAQKEELQEALNLAQEAVAKQAAQLEEITHLNQIASEYNDAMANAGYGMWHIILKDGVTPRMQVNDKMAELLGIAGQKLSEEELYNAWYDQITPDAIPSVQTSVGEMIAGNFSENTYQWIHPTKGVIYVRCGGTAVTLEDGTNVLSGYHADVTDIVLEEQNHNKVLEKAKKDAEAANAAKTAFLFNMSHDIRTPMNAILGFTDLTMKHYDDREKCMDYLHKTQEANKLLLSLINNVLEMARIESGKEQLDETVCHTGVVTHEIISIFEDKMRQKNITFTSNVEFRTSYVLCDQSKLREICLNILSNAVKYTPVGGSISVQMLEQPSKRPGYIRIYGVCADSGIGMSKEFLPHLFEEFSRAQTATESGQQGTGLGMPIVKKLIDLMGGSIEVESELGKGTTFTVILELKIVDTPPETKLESRGTEANEDFKGKRILLAEDNDLNAEIAIEILSEAGFEVERAADGIICVDMLQKAEYGYYDVILMDVQMPNMNGYKTTQIIRAMKDSFRKNIPIIAMTANAFDEDRKNALDAGMNGHIAKPIEIAKLMETLESILK